MQWSEQPAEAWPQRIPVTNLNAAHVDTDGNGIIDFPDQLAIDQNWTNATPWYDPNLDLEQLLPIQSQFAADIFVVPDTVMANAPATFLIQLGTEEQPAEEVYGLAFSIYFDDFVVDTNAQISLSFNDSWLGQWNSDLIATYRVFPAEERIDVGITRVDGQALTGYGTIGQINITIEDVIFFTNEHHFNFSIGTQKLLNSLGQPLPSNAMETTSLIQGSQPSSTVPYLGIPYAAPSLFPNPSHGWVSYRFDRPVPIQQLLIIRPDGSIAKTLSDLPTGAGQLSLEGLAPGIYQLHWVLGSGTVISKLAVW